MKKSPTPIIFVPGLGTRGEITYKPLLAHLRQRYEVRVADHSLDLPKKLDWQFFYRAIDKAIARNKKVYLLGHSMGGAVVLGYAANHPQKLVKTIAVAPVLFPFARDHDPFRRVRSVWLSLRGLGLSHLIEAAKVRKRVLDEGRRRPLYNWTGWIDLTPMLSKVRQATVLWPAKEEIIPYRHFRRVRRDFPNVKTKHIAGSHNNMALYPSPILHALEDELYE